MLYEIFVILIAIAVIFSVVSLREPLIFSILAAILWFVCALQVLNVEFYKVIILQNETINTTYNLTVLNSTAVLFKYAYYDTSLSYLFMLFGFVFLILWIFTVLDLFRRSGRK